MHSRAKHEVNVAVWLKTGVLWDVLGQ